MNEPTCQRPEPAVALPEPAPMVVTMSGPPVVYGTPRGPRRRKKQGISWVWGISGGGVLSALGFVALTLYQQYNDSVNELQRDLKHFNTASTELVRKDEFHNRMAPLWGQIQKLEKQLIEKSERLLLVEHELKLSQEDRREQIRELQHLRERLASLEGQQSPGRRAGADAPSR